MNRYFKKIKCLYFWDKSVDIWAIEIKLQNRIQ